MKLERPDWDGLDTSREATVDTLVEGCSCQENDKEDILDVDVVNKGHRGSWSEDWGHRGQSEVDKVYSLWQHLKREKKNLYFFWDLDMNPPPSARPLNMGHGWVFQQVNDPKRTVKVEGTWNVRLKKKCNKRFYPTSRSLQLETSWLLVLLAGILQNVLIRSWGCSVFLCESQCLEFWCFSLHSCRVIADIWKPYVLSVSNPSQEKTLQV